MYNQQKLFYHKRKKWVNAKNLEGVEGGGNKKGSLREGAVERGETEGVSDCYTRLPSGTYAHSFHHSVVPLPLGGRQRKGSFREGAAERMRG